ncbi:MAG TPA: hypothetical protein VEU51_13140 [Candidatus Acidoferrales bacterium]|nr:hypothetical protein [Candidatus Acidoferrales bacterium]
MTQSPAARRTGVLIFVLTLLVFLISPVWGLSDACFSMLVSESIIHRHSTYLNAYRFPAPIRESVPCVSPAPPVPRDFVTYQLDRVNGNVVYCYPNGSSILSIPFVAVMNLLGVYPYAPDGVYNHAGEAVIQRMLAALLMAGYSFLVFRMALIVLSVTPATVIALGTAFGTQVWSTASRAMWAHTWFIFLGGLIAYSLLKRETGSKGFGPIMLATLLSWMFFVRPTGAIPIVCVSVYLFLYYRHEFIRYAVAGGAWFAGFVAYSRLTYGRSIPEYYLDSQLNPRGLATSLQGILISPSRGLFVYVPVALFVLYLLIRYWKTVPHRRLATLALAMTALQVFTIALWSRWWGGASYGPRLLADAVPWLALLAVLGCAARVDGAGALRFSRVEVACAATLLALSIAINGRGAWSWETTVWNLEVDLDRHPERTFDWSYPQFIAGIVARPDRR